jgi:type IV secretory pathway VirB2 component (pilin)
MRRKWSVVVALTSLVAIASPAWAGTAGSDMPWDAPLSTLLANLTGPTARIFAGIMLVIAGITWGFTRHEEGAKRFGQGIFAIAIMFAAVQIVGLLQFAGALV